MNKLLQYIYLVNLSPGSRDMLLTFKELFTIHYLMNYVFFRQGKKIKSKLSR